MSDTLTITGTPGTAVVGNSFTFSPTISGGTSPYTVAADPALPSGFILNTTTGTISSTAVPTTGFTTTLTVTDSTATTAQTATLSVSVSPVGAVSITAISQSTYEGSALSVTPPTNGGSGTKTFTVTSGSLPNGISINTSTGELTGSATAAGTYTFTISVADDTGTSSAKCSLTIYAKPSITNNTPQIADVGKAFSWSPTTVGGNGTLTITVDSSKLPAGLTADSSGTISGTPTASGSASIAITVSDGVVTTDQTLSLTVSDTLTLTAASTSRTVSPGADTTVSFTTTGGSAPITYTTSSDNPGFTFDAASGSFHSSSAAVGSYSFSVTATDVLGATSTATCSVTVKDPLSLSGSIGYIVVNKAFTFTPTVKNDAHTLTFSYSGDLPPDTSVSSITGVISGTVTKTQNPMSGTLTATDTVTGETATLPITFTTTTAVTSQDGTVSGYVGKSVSYTPTVTGGYGTRTFSVTEGSIPAGLSLDSVSGLISGSPANSQNSTVKLTVTDSSGSSTFTLTFTLFAIPSITNASIENGEVGIPLSWSAETAGGNGTALTVIIDSSTLPEGITVQSGGSISGTPTASGTYEVSATVTDGKNPQNVIITVSVAPALAITDTYSVTTTVGNATTTALTATSGTGVKSVSWSIADGTDTTKFALNGNVVSINASSDGTFVGKFLATDEAGGTALATVTAYVLVPISFSYSASKLEQGVEASFSPIISGGSGAYVFTINANTPLPDGISLDADTGVLSGTPTKSGTFPVSITATDASQATLIKTINLTLTTADPLSIGGTFPAIINIGDVVKFIPDVDGGLGTNTFTLSGTLPNGLTFDKNTGGISGSPTTVGSTNVSISVTDGVVTKTLPVYIVATNKLTVSVSTKNMEVGVAGQILFTTSGGAGTKTSNLSSGTLPKGLTLTEQSNGDPIITGTPVISGLSTFVITVADETATIDTEVTFTIYDKLAITPPPGSLLLTTGKDLNFSPAVVGGSPDKTYSISKGALPTHVVIDASTGVISGTPDRGQYNFTVRIADAFASVTQDYTLLVNDPLKLSYDPIIVVMGKSVSISPDLSGDPTGAVTYSSSTLPDGLTIDPSTGIISGIPSISTTSTVTVTAQDSLSSTTASVSINIESALTITGDFPEMVLGKAVSFIPTTNGGVIANYKYSISGTLPGGVTFNSSTGVISGTPTDTVGNNGTIVISLTDGTQTATLKATLNIYTSISVKSTSVTGEVGAKFSFTPSTSGGNGAKEFSLLSGGALPLGLSIDASSGVISGTPQVKTNGLLLTFLVEDDTGSQTFTITFLIKDAISLTGIAQKAIKGTSYQFIPSVSGGTGTTVFSILSGSLPLGLSLDKQTGIISGIPTNTGSSTFMLSVSDGSLSSQKSFTIVTVDSVASQNDAATALVVQGCANYISYASITPATELSMSSAMRTMGDIVLTIISTPTTAAMDALWNVMSVNKDTYFAEYNFFRGITALDAKTFQAVQAVYTAFRSIMISPNTTFDFSYLLRVTSCQPLVAYLNVKKATLTAS